MQNLDLRHLHVEGANEDETLGFLNQVTLQWRHTHIHPQHYDKSRKNENIHVLNSMCSVLSHQNKTLVSGLNVILETEI